jgi:hypothetical protein
MFGAFDPLVLRQKAQAVVNRRTIVWEFTDSCAGVYPRGYACMSR